jgi:hypothetical protein
MGNARDWIEAAIQPAETALNSGQEAQERQQVDTWPDRGGGFGGYDCGVSDGGVSSADSGGYAGGGSSDGELVRRRFVRVERLEGTTCT